MPNCDFYAAETDIEQVLSWVFENLECRVFEMYSPLDQCLTEYKSVADIKWSEAFSKLGRGGSPLHLALWPVKASSEVTEKRISLNPAKCNGHTFRYTLTGWGLIQLYFGGVKNKGMEHSHTNHNSEKRADKWESTNADEMGDPKQWNWREVTSTSSKLNRYIRKLATSKIGSRSVLPCAHKVIENGATAL